MKKSLLALAALTAFAGVASAQSSVTLFGVVDLNARSTKTGSTSVKSLSQDGNASSRLGFRGVEDLGGGMRAGFWLEAGVNPDVGGTNTTNAVNVNGSANASTPAVSQFFNRRSTVSLMGGFGEIRLGRDYTPSFWNYTVFDVFGTNGVASMSNLASAVSGSGAQTFVRANNTIGYFLPAMGGLYGQVQVAAGEYVRGNKYVGGRLGYAAGPVNVAVAYGKTAQTGGPGLSSTGVFTASASNQMVDAHTDMNVGASFNAGFMTVVGQYSKREYSTADQKTMNVGVAVPVGAGTIKASYTKTSATPATGDGKQIGLGYVHDLSKRSALYTHFAKINKPGTTADVTAYEFGVRHSF